MNLRKTVYFIYTAQNTGMEGGPHAGQMNAHWIYPIQHYRRPPALWFQNPYHENFLQVDLAVVHLIEGMLIRGNEMSTIPVYSSEMKYDISDNGTVWEGFKVHQINIPMLPFYKSSYGAVYTKLMHNCCGTYHILKFPFYMTFRRIF